MTTIKKPRKKRFLTDEEKAERAERLKKAREARAANQQPKYEYVHESVRNLPDDAPLSRKNVTEWIKYQKEKLSAAKQNARRKDAPKGADMQVADIQGYIRNMERYLRDGDWCDDFWGKEGTNKTKWRSVVNAYHWQGPMKGMIKRSVGIFYPDLGVEWTREMDDEYYGPYRAPSERSSTVSGKKRRTRRKKIA